MILLPSDFYGDRLGTPIRYLVIHTSEGTDSRSWLTKTGNVSSHYLVRHEDTYSLVDEDLEAWHAGRIVGTPTTPLYTGGNPNFESIGIEMEGYAAGPVDPVIVAKTAALIRDIRSRRGPLPLVDHRELSPGDRTDPGIWRASLDKELEEHMTPEQEAKLDRVLSLLEAREPLIWIARAQRSLDVESGKVFDQKVPAKDPRVAQ